jgi:hypothetical protein
MAGKATKRWWPILLVVLGVPVAGAASLSVASEVLGSGVGSPAPCFLVSPTVVQNVGANTTNVVSVDVGGIDDDCGGGTVRVSVFNGTATAQEATKAIPAGGGSVNLTLTTPVALKDAHLVSVTVQGP